MWRRRRSCSSRRIRRPGSGRIPSRISRSITSHLRAARKYSNRRCCHDGRAGVVTKEFRHAAVPLSVRQSRALGDTRELVQFRSLELTFRPFVSSGKGRRFSCPRFVEPAAGRLAHLARLRLFASPRDQGGLLLPDVLLSPRERGLLRTPTFGHPSGRVEFAAAATVPALLGPRDGSPIVGLLGRRCRRRGRGGPGLAQA